jgi:hypothetical protein
LVEVEQNKEFTMKDNFQKDGLPDFSRKEQVFENRLSEKIGYLLYSIIFVGVFVSAFAQSGLSIAGNLLGLNSGLLFGFNRIKKYMQLDLDQSRAKAYWYILIVLEIILGVSLYLTNIESYLVTIFSVLFIFLFTSMAQLILLNVFSIVILTIIPQEAYIELQSHIKFIFFNTYFVYEIPYEARLSLYRATFFDKPDNISVGTYYIQVRRPEGIVVHIIKMKAMPSNRASDIEQFFENVPNFEISPKLQNAIKREKKMIIVFLIMMVLSIILPLLLSLLFE